MLHVWKGVLHDCEALLYRGSRLLLPRQPLLWFRVRLLQHRSRVTIDR